MLLQAPSELVALVASAMLRLLLCFRLPSGSWRHFTLAWSMRRRAASIFALRAGRLAQAGNWWQATTAAQLSLVIHADPVIAVLLGDCLMNADSTGFMA